MSVKVRIALLLSLGVLPLSAGCALFRKPTSPSTYANPATPEQRAWWEANREKARYVPGRGYYVEGTSGFFDDTGRPLVNNMPVAPEEEEDTEGFNKYLSPNRAIKKFKVMIGKGPNEQIARKSFEEGEGLFRQSKYAEAAKKFKVAYKRWPDSELEEEALFLAGESEFFSDHYPAAEDAYDMLVKKYSGTQYLDKISTRRFAIARYWEQDHTAHPHWPITPNVTNKTRPNFDELGHALKTYERVRLDDPTGPLADDSIMATANAYFIEHRYEDADYHYGLIRTEYPKSDHQWQAHVLGLRAKLLKYQGPDYDGTPLKEAEDLIAQMLTQFPDRVGEERERLKQAQGEIHIQRALREWHVAEYYHKNKYYAASRMHFSNIAKNYPDTQLAKEALAKIDAVKGEPGTPTHSYDWLVQIFPESKKSGPSIANLSPPVPNTTTR